MIILGLGSNLNSSFGDRFKNLNLALALLEKNKIYIVKKSSFYETPSYPNNKYPKFINIVISIDTNLEPIKLMSALIMIEEKLERKRKKKYDPRTCDIDIIDYNNQIPSFKYKDSEIILPHKELIYRSFVLFPLQEIYPEWIYPITKENIKTLIQKLTTDQKKSILKIKKD